MKLLRQLLEDWMYRIFQTPETTFVFLFGLVLVSLTFMMGNLLMPVFVGIAISYIMLGLKLRLMRWGMSPLFAFTFSYSLFLCTLLLLLFVVLPVMVSQLGDFAGSLPQMLAQIRELIQGMVAGTTLAQNINLDDIMASLLPQMTNSATEFSAAMLARLGDALTLAVYLVLVPVMVFFFMKDYVLILRGIGRFLPGEKGLAADLWRQIDEMLSNYVRGKVLEIIAVWFASQVLFSLMGLQYATLLALLTGLSVVVPVVGALVVTVPIIVVASLQWGFTVPFWGLTAAYMILQIVDGYILVPLIFAETMKIHAVLVIMSVLIFGGLWGFWGAFMAIPLATLIKILLESWPNPEQQLAHTPAE